MKNLLNQPDLKEKAGLRDKAMLELLYATGLRVSEMIDLDLENVNLSLGYLRCFGKGSKERIVPLGKLSVEYLSLYINNARPKVN